ncbi:MAG: hypothetical protein ACFB0B_01690 [Thermonemataceae bacterium]
MLQKQRKLLLSIGLLIAVTFTACENEEIITSPQNSQSTQARSTNLCGPQTICYTEEITVGFNNFGSKVCRSAGRGECRAKTGRKICVEFEGFCNIPALDDLFDPLEILESVNSSIFDRYADQLDVEGFRGKILVPGNERIVFEQFYEGIEGVINQEVYEVAGSVMLDPAVVENYGLSGNVIPAGKYPVIFNEENQTYNAVVAVQSYPVTYEVPVATLTTDAFDGSLNSLLETSFDLSEAFKAHEINQDVFYVGSVVEVRPTPHPFIEGIYAFSSNQSSLYVQFVQMGIEAVTLEDTELSSELASLLGVAPYELRSDMVDQHYDEANDILTVIVNRPL